MIISMIKIYQIQALEKKTWPYTLPHITLSDNCILIEAGIHRDEI